MPGATPEKTIWTTLPLPLSSSFIRIKVSWKKENVPVVSRGKKVTIWENESNPS